MKPFKRFLFKIKKKINHINKNCLEMQGFSISNDESVNSINYLTGKITWTPDNIPLFFGKHTFYFTIFPILLFSKCSLATSFVPKQLKILYAISIHKKGSKFNLLSYRPFSLTSSFEKYFNILFHKTFDHLFLITYFT